MWPIVQSCLLVLVAFIFQATVVPHMAVLGAKPDIVIILTALYGFTYGPQIGTVAGFFGGLLGDLLSGPHVGVGLISKSIVGFFAGLVKRAIFVENVLLTMLAIFIATCINQFIYVGFMFLLGEATPIKVLITGIVLPSATYNTILAPFVYMVLRRFMVFKQEAPVVRIAKKYD